MERFNIITKLIATPALVIALTAGAAMAGPLQHVGGNAHRGADFGQSEMTGGAAPLAGDITVTGKIVNRIANLSPLEATTNTAAETTGVGATSQNSNEIHTELQILYIKKCRTGCNSDLQQKIIRAYSYYIPDQHIHIK